MDEDELSVRYKSILWPSTPSPSESERLDKLQQLRYMVLFEGFPPYANTPDVSRFGPFCSLRGLVWKALLGIGQIDPDYYTHLVERGPSKDVLKINADAIRTFNKYIEFTDAVPTEKLIRLLNAFVHDLGNIKETYVQSMSILCAPFLWVMPEPEAFFCFRHFLSHNVPTYVKKYSGVLKGCELLDECLTRTKPELRKLLKKHKLEPAIYAFSSLSSLNACVPPLSDTIRLWDVLLAFGAHLAVLFTLSRLLLASDSLLSLTSEKCPLQTRELEKGLGSTAEQVIAKTLTVSQLLDDALYARLQIHTLSVALKPPQM